VLSRIRARIAKRTAERVFVISVTPIGRSGTACGGELGNGHVLFGSPTTTSFYTQGGRESSFWPALTYDAAARASLAFRSRTR
jgi:hypothetical protein